MKKIIQIVSCLFLINSVFVLSCSNDSKLSNLQLKNLVAFTKIYGYVKYFHPSSEAKDIDWNSFAIIGTREILKANNIDESKKILVDLFSPIAPSILLYKEGDNDSIFKLNSIVPRDTTNFKHVYWKHIGDGNDSRGVYMPLYKSFIVNMDSVYSTPNFDSIYIGDLISTSLGNGLAIKLPLSLYYNETTFPIADQTKLIDLRRKLYEESKNRFDVYENYYPIANIVIAWNVFEYFYPYFDQIDEVLSTGISPNDYWYSQLENFLQKASDDKSDLEHFETLKKLVASLDDGHGYVYYLDDPELYYPHFKAKWIQDSVVITEILNPEERDVKIGDVITKIDNVDVYEVMKEKEKLISSATPQLKKIRSVEQELFKGEYTNDITVTVSRNNSEFTKVFKRDNPFTYKSVNDITEIIKMENDVYYVSLMGIRFEDFFDKLDILSKSNGVIFDMRGYPSNTITSVLQYLSDSTLQTSIYMKPIMLKPESPVKKYDTDGRWSLEPELPRINSKIIFLTDGHAMSYSETIMSIVENYKLGEIIGTPTAGTNGNVNGFHLPGNYSISYTGMKVLKHDGSRFHGIGVQPTIFVEPTIEGIRQIKDEILERAIEEINK